MTVLKRNFQNKEYESTIKQQVNSPCIANFDKIINCINCNKEVVYGNCYISKQYHNVIGIWFPVCSDCHKKELKEIKKYRNL